MSTFLLCPNINAPHLLNIMFWRFACTQAFIRVPACLYMAFGLKAKEAAAKKYLCLQKYIKINYVFISIASQHNNVIQWFVYKANILNVLTYFGILGE